MTRPRSPGHAAETNNHVCMSPCVRVCVCASFPLFLAAFRLIRSQTCGVSSLNERQSAKLDAAAAEEAAMPAPLLEAARWGWC